MKRIIIILFLGLPLWNAQAQVTIAGDYKVIDIGSNGVGDYTRSVILLHEIYDGTLINHNYAIGTITAMRGHTAAFNRLNTVTISSSSAYNGTNATITAYDDYNSSTWKLKTCIYQSKRYLALEVPHSSAYHNWGFKFLGSTISSGENMKCVSYEVNGLPYNQNLISNIQDFSSNMLETHEIQDMHITGNLGIGISPTEKLSVNGKIRAHEIKIELTNWPDYVFADDYHLPTLKETEKHIKEKGHLQGIPSAGQVKANGIDLGEMNAKLLQKIEELTLHLIEMKKENDIQKEDIKYLKSKLK